MNLPLIIYLADLADSISIAAISICFIVGIFSLLVFAVIMAHFDVYGYREEKEKKAISYFKKLSLIFFPSLLIVIVTPSSSTIYMMLSASIFGDTAENIYQSDIYKDVLEIIDLKIKDIKNDLLKGS